MKSKKIIAAALAATITTSVSPINVMGDNEINNFDLGYSEDDNKGELMLMSAENIDVRKISETDTSITVSWSGFDSEKIASYTVVCDGLESKKISDTSYTVIGLTSGCEYSITVRAYDVDDKLVGVSEAIYAYTDWNVTSDVTLTSNKTVADLNISGNLDLNGYILTVAGDVYLTESDIYVNRGKMYVSGNFNMSSTNGNYGSGYLNMSNAEDYICVNGDFLAYSYYAGSTLTDGTIEVKGSFNQKRANYANNFAPGGKHKVILSGRGIQKVNFESEQSMFNILEITKPLETGYVFSRTPLWNELSEKNSDNEPPTAPENLHAERSTSTSIKITWNESEDESGIYCYYVYRDGEKIGSTKNLYYVDTGLNSYSQYMYYVIACDVDGNMSEKSNIIEAATDADEYAPTQPANFTAVVKDDSTIYLSWIASSDNVKVVEYNIYRNGVLIAKTEGTAYTDKNAFAGLYTYYVEAVDNEGNVSTASKKVTVDNEAPTKPILTLSKVEDSYISLEWTCSDNVGVTFYNIYRNNVLVKTVAANSYVDTNISIDSHYTYYVIAYDASENKSEASNEVSVYTGEDSTAPEIVSIYAAKNKYAKTLPISVSATDNRAVAAIYVQSSVDNITWEDALSIKADGKTSSNVIENLDLMEYSDGELNLRAYAEDSSGNKSGADDSPVFKITVDNTAPNSPYDLITSTENGYLELKWDTFETDTDIEYFKIYRRENDGADYTLVADNYRYWNYIDKDIGFDIRYYYAVSAVDDVGNESLLSEEAMNCISDDKISPVIHSINPVANSKIGEKPIISVFCSDNFKLGTFTAEMKRSDNEEWTQIYTEVLSSYASVVEFELDTTDYKDGDYDIRVKISDSVGNVSEYTNVKYNYRKCALSSPLLTADPIGWGAELSWDMTDSTELAEYTVFRKAVGENIFRVIGRTVDTKFTDIDAEAGKTFYYRVDASDIRGNIIEGNIASVVPTYEDSYEPTAVAGEGICGIAGKSISFDGTASYDNHYIESYHWDFGDGTTSDLAKISHTFASEGEYFVSLTVYDSAGNSNTDNITVRVYPENYNSTKIKITDKNGVAIPNTRIYCETLPETLDAMSDSFGCYDFIYPDGDFDVYVYRNGYLPQMITISSAERKADTYVSLEEQNVITGNITVKELDFNEINALGIDINAPENQNVYEYDIDLNFDIKYNICKREKIYVNGKGDIIRKYSSGNAGGNGSGGSGRGGSRQTYVKFYSGPSSWFYKWKKTPAVYVAVMSVESNTTWLKEFYDVQLSIINNADEEFCIEGASAELNIPDGLSFAGTDRGEKSSYNLGKILGGSEKSASWILRGDKAGSYNLAAEFTGKLMPFNEEITINFETDEPLIVNGSDALSITFNQISDSINKWDVEFTVTNTSNKTLNNVKLDFNQLSDKFLHASNILIEYPSGIIECISWNEGNCDEKNTKSFLPALYGDNDFTDSRDLNPGQSIKGKFTVTGHKDDEYIY